MNLLRVVATDGRNGYLYAANVIPGNVVTALVTELHNGCVRTVKGDVSPCAIVFILRDLIVRSAHPEPPSYDWLLPHVQQSTRVHTYEGARYLHSSGQWYWEQAAGRCDGSLATWEAAQSQDGGDFLTEFNRLRCPNYTPRVTRIKTTIPAGMRVWDPNLGQVVVSG
ncbi:hypothetical protein QFW19_004173 [Escherichia coli]|nr:hypothetical protein [Escherichia coli]